MSAEPHGGSGHAYSNLHCRCDECRAAHARRIKRRREERTNEIRQDPSRAAHGSLSTYRNWGCRCAPCTAANRAAVHSYARSNPEKVAEYRRRYRDRKRAS